MSMPNPAAPAPQMDQSAWWLSHNVWAIDAQRAPISPVRYKPPAWMAEAEARDKSCAYVPVYGVLTPHGWWGTSYDALKMRLSAAAQDPAVERIVLMVDSPGGDAAGVAGAVAAVKAAAEEKPVIAYVDGMACSAAYWLASQADHIVATETSLVGSIGAIMTAYSLDRMLKELGVDKVTMRSEGAPDKALNPANSDRGRELDQQLLNDLEAQFHASVAEGRGVSVEMVRRDFGQGALFVAGEGQAQRRGLIDAVGTLDTALDYGTEAPTNTFRFNNDAPAPSAGDGGNMAANKRQTAPATETEANPLAAQVETLTADLTAAKKDLAAAQAKVAEHEAKAEEATKLAASYGERLATLEASLKEQTAARLAVEKKTALDALDDAGHFVANERERAERMWAAQHEQGVAGVWDDYKASLEARGPVVPGDRKTHGAEVPHKDPLADLHEKATAYAEKNGVDYLAALKAVQAA
jgi:capsid assembly protease